MSLINYPKNILPREKAIKYGIQTLSDIELLAIILRSGTKNSNVLEIASNIIDKAGCISNLVFLTHDDLIQIEGLGKIKVLELKAIIQLLKRLNKIKKENFIYIQNPGEIFDLYKKRFEFIKQEHFLILSLDTKNALIDEHTVFVGTLSQSLIHPREIFNRLIIKSAASFICIHNHPSNHTKPSDNDVEVTKHLLKISELFGIPLLDHIIIGKDNYFSFKENNMI